MGHVENRRLGVGVHGNDQLGVLHALLVLRRAADAQGEIELGLDRHARLAHLPRGRQPALVHHRPRGADRAAQRLGEFLGKFQVVLLLDAAAHRHEHVLLRDVHVAGRGQDPVVEGDRPGRQRRAELPLLATMAFPAWPSATKTARQDHEDRRCGLDLHLGQHLAAAERRGDAQRVALGPRPLCSRSRAACPAWQPTAGPGPSRSTWRDQHRPRPFRRHHFLKAARNGSGE